MRTYDQTCRESKLSPARRWPALTIRYLRRSSAATPDGERAGLGCYPSRVTARGSPRLPTDSQGVPQQHQMVSGRGKGHAPSPGHSAKPTQTPADSQGFPPRRTKQTGLAVAYRKAEANRRKPQLTAPHASGDRRQTRGLLTWKAGANHWLLGPAVPPSSGGWGGVTAYSRPLRHGANRPRPPAALRGSFATPKGERARSPNGQRGGGGERRYGFAVAAVAVPGAAAAIAQSHLVRACTELCPGKIVVRLSASNVRGR